MEQKSNRQRFRRVPAPHGGNLSKEQFEARKSADLLSTESFLSKFRYPIENRKQLLTHIRDAGGPFYFRGLRIDPNRAIEQLPDGIFPLKSANDFARQLQPHLKNLAGAVRKAPLRQLPLSSKGSKGSKG
jgi:hypothetical protein